MTVLELRRVLDTLPDDMEVVVYHHPHGAHPLALFTNEFTHSAIISPSNKITMPYIEKRCPHWKHINKPSEE